MLNICNLPLMIMNHPDSLTLRGLFSSSCLQFGNRSPCKVTETMAIITTFLRRKHHKKPGIPIPELIVRNASGPPSLFWRRWIANDFPGVATAASLDVPDVARGPGSTLCLARSKPLEGLSIHVFIYFSLIWHWFIDNVMFIY